MRFFHLSDLHIGKQLHRYSLLEDQKHILSEVIGYVEKMKPDGMVIGGDIYDKSVPSGEAVSLFDDFLTELADLEPGCPVLIISGNHDSSKRLDYASRILGRQNIHIAGTVPDREEEHVKKVILSDKYGEVDFYLLPFLKPGYVRHLFESEETLNYSEAVARILEREGIDKSRRNVLVSHQFYTGKGGEPKTCDSEMFSVGGIDNVDIGPLLDFEYVALGHIHGAQQVGEPHIRYCGTLLKYSVSEAGHTKSLHLVELGEKGQPVKVELLPLHPLRDVRVVRGELQTIIDNAKEETNKDYVSITLTDEIDPYKPKEQLERVFPYILEIRMDNTRTRTRLEEFVEAVELTNPLTVFGEFYKEVQGKELSVEEHEIVESTLERIKGE